MENLRRKVFYLSGFDPRGARFYYGLLDEQAAALAQQGLHLGRREKCGQDTRWTVEDTAGRLHVDFSFLGWDDLVRAHWVKGAWPLLRHVAKAYGGYLRHLDWRLVGQWPKGTQFTVFSPGAILLVVPVVLAIVFLVALQMVAPAIVPLAASGAAALAFYWAVVLAGALVFAAAVWGYALRHFHSLWVARFMVFNDQLARRATDPALELRLLQFARSISSAFSEEWDEILFITHSNGSTLSVPVMAHLLAVHGGKLPGHFALITLGSCTQLLAARRDAGWFGHLLDSLGGGGFAWLDIGSPTDGACAPLVAPCQGRPISRPPGLVQLSPRWFRYCDPATYLARRGNKYQTHFDYLRRLDRPSSIDFLGLTCSPLRLAQAIANFEDANAPA